MRKATTATSEQYRWGDRCDGWHFLKRDDGSVIKEKMPPGACEPMHSHEKAREFFYILLGAATFRFNAKEIEVGPGEGIEIEPKEPHQIRNEGPEALEFLRLSYPSAEFTPLP